MKLINFFRFDVYIFKKKKKNILLNEKLIFSIAKKKFQKMLIKFYYKKSYLKNVC